MGIRTTAKKSYPIAGSGEIPGTSSLPTVEFRYRSYEDLNKFDLIFVVSNALTVSLSKQFRDGSSGALIGKPEISDVKDFEFQTFTKNRSYTTVFILTATNSIGSVSTLPLYIDPAIPNIIDLPDEIVSDFKISRETDSYDLINSQLTLSITDVFDISKLSSLELFYKRKDFEQWKSLILSKDNPIVLKSNNGSESGYVFDFKKQPISRPNSGGYFDFYIKINLSNIEPVYTSTKTLFFDNLDDTAPQRPKDSSISTNIVDIENPATLRYEISTKFSEVYTITNNSSSIDQNDVQSSPADSYSHGFLDTNKFKGLSVGSYTFVNENGKNLFYYEYDNAGTKGYFYPASVSEIYPCIVTNKEGGSNKSIVLYWKVNDDFFDYSFFENNISITTTNFQVKLQYKDSSSYVDLTNAIKITKDPVQMSANENTKFGFFSKYQKFVLSIERDVDIKNNTAKSLFDRISESDNSSDNLRLVVLKHDVDCYFGGVTRSYFFDKMLMPPNWKYIAYDKYITNKYITNTDLEIRTASDKKINLDLASPILRGIKLPDAGFYKYDQLNGLKVKFSDSYGNSAVTTFDFKILYKLSCEYDVFYRDPVLEGTVNSILLPSIPNDVFLIPPTLKVSPPNLVPESQGGKQAEGIVKLNEYGKIVGLQITDPGHGYSLFKTLQSKREQTFTDLVPFVKKSFQIVANDLNISRSVLTLQNNSFDKENLVASLEGGVRLASAYADKQRLEQNGGNSFSAEQKAKLDDYLNYNLPEESSNTENSVELYNLEMTEEEKDVSSIGILNETWNIISKLYTDKYINPIEQSQVYTEDTDASVSEIEESSIPSTINTTKDSTAITPISLNPNVQQKSASGGSPELFSLNGLTIVPDASAAVFVSSKFNVPPWLTLLPLSVRADGQYGFGPLANMLPRAEMFNRLVMGINNLNEVRVILPMIWAVDQKNTNNTWYDVSSGENEYELISFNTNGTKVGASSESSSYLPINSQLGVSASRSVTRSELKADEAEPIGLSANVYKVSSEDSSAVSFKPFVHPLMAKSFKESYLRTFKRKILGIVTEQTTTCVNNNAPIGIGGYTAIGCNGIFGDAYEKQVPAGTLLPTPNENYNTYFAFFDAGGTIEASARGTAQALSVSNGTNNGRKVFCTYNCGDSYSKSIDFRYANMFPGTIKI
jgi:hypothetical protein